MKKILILIIAALLMSPVEVEQAKYEPIMVEEQELPTRASEAIEEPISALEEQPYFNQYNLRELSNLNLQQIYNILEGTDLQTISSTYLYLEEACQVNAFFLIALSAHESGWGTSYRALNQNNLTGFAVYSDEAEGGHFNSWSESLAYTANLLDKEYLTEGGKYFNGYGIEEVNIRYCLKDDEPDFNWSKSITSICYELLERS